MRNSIDKSINSSINNSIRQSSIEGIYDSIQGSIMRNNDSEGRRILSKLKEIYESTNNISEEENSLKE